MAQNIVESIFNSKQLLNRQYPRLSEVKVFDLHKKHMHYGRIDDEGDAIYLNDSNIKQIDGGLTETHLAIDFVSRAFSDMKKHMKSAANKGFISKDSIYPSSLGVFKSWSTGDLEHRYDSYLNNLYTTFVDSYLSIDRRADKIKNYKDFVKEFLRFSLRTAKNFPVTKTAFITSVHSSPFISGLMVEIAPETHALETNARVVDYIKDRNFIFFVNEAKKFGFMVDKNAPWRIVFNLASGMLDKNEESSSLTGGQFYMDKFAVNYDNIFKTYYRKAYLDEHLNLKRKLYSLYESFYIQFSTYETIKYVTNNSSRCEKVNIVHERKDREPPNKLEFTAPGKENDEYWLRILLKLRLAESDKYHDPESFNFHAGEATKLTRLFELKAGIRYINELTRGFPVTNFLSKGHYWYGISEKEYQQKKTDLLKNVNDPSIVDYALTGTKNIK